jgi:hypothetical protein
MQNSKFPYFRFHVFNLQMLKMLTHEKCGKNRERNCLIKIWIYKLWIDKV